MDSVQVKTPVDITDLRKYECPICLNWLNEPMLTTCGHHFCKTCITSWLNKNSPCPIDGKQLTETDVFPDQHIRRELADVVLKCPNTNNGCGVELKIGELDMHLNTCAFKRDVLRCSFRRAGCKFTEESDEALKDHYREHTQQHLEMLCEKFFIHRGTSLVSETKLWEPSGKQTDTTDDTTQSLIRAMYERVVVLEQRASELEVVTNQQNKRMIDAISNQNVLDEMKRLNCGGVYVWFVANFEDKFRSGRKTSVNLYSDGFYTSSYGYKFCIRLNVAAEKTGDLGVYVHLMRTEHDSTLVWPFSGRIIIEIVHPTNSNETLREVMLSECDLEAFQRPNERLNPVGFGHKKFVEIHELFTNGFVHAGKLTLKIDVKSG